MKKTYGWLPAVMLIALMLNGCFDSGPADDDPVEQDTGTGTSDSDTDSDTGSDTDDPDGPFFWSPSDRWRMGVDTDGLMIIAGHTFLGTKTAFWYNEDSDEQYSVSMNGLIDDFAVSPSGGFIATETTDEDYGPETFGIYGYTRDGERWSTPLPKRVEYTGDTFSGACNAEYATAMNMGINGTFIVVGAFSGEIVLGEGQNNEVTLGTANDETLNTFMARYTTDGYLEWAAKTEFKLLPDSLTVADDGTVFVFGTHSSVESPITVVFDSEGNTVWANDQGVVGDPDHTFFDYKVSTLLADDGSYYVASHFYEIVILTDRFGAEIELSAPIEMWESGWTASLGYFIARYSSDGELLWAQNTYEGEFENRASILSTGAFLMNGTDLVISGLELLGSVTFGSGETNETVAEHPGQFIVSYHSDGTLKWIKHVGELLVSFAAGVQTDTDEMFFSGRFIGDIILEDGSTITSNGYELGDFFLIKQTEL